MTVATFIFARGGSKGIPDKNIKIFNGKPLITWSIECALSLPQVDHVYISTDSELIAKVAHESGATIPFMRPSELATDDCSEWLAWQHAAKFLRNKYGNKFSTLLSIPATAPLRMPIDIDLALSKYVKDKPDVVITVAETSLNPYFNMVRVDEYGSVLLASNSDINYHRRQDTPNIYSITTVAYVVSIDFLLANNRLFDGVVKSIVVPQERSIDIDSELDFKLAQYLHSERLNAK